MLEALNSLLHQADVYVYTPLGLGVQHIADAQGKPGVALYFQPTFPSTHMPSVLISTDLQLPGLVNRLSYQWIEFLTDQTLRKMLNQFRSTSLHVASLSPRMSVLEYQRRNAALHIFAMPAMAAPSDLADYPNTVVTGFFRPPTFDSDETRERTAHHLGLGKDPVVYFGMGSAPPRRPERVARAVVETVKPLGAHLVVQGDWMQPYLHDMPSHRLTVLGPVNHHWLFEHVDVTVQHGGAGTLHAALATATPVVIEPTWFDQYFWRKWSENMGVAAAQSRFATVERRIRSGVTAGLESKTLKRNSIRLRDTLLLEDGLQAATDAIVAIT